MKYVLVTAVMLTLALSIGAVFRRSTEARRPQYEIAAPARVEPAPAPAADAEPVHVRREVLATVTAPVPERIEWALKHELNDQSARTDPAFSTYYKTNSDESFPVMLNGEEEHEQYLALSERTPHCVRWEIQFEYQLFKDGWNKALQCSTDGFYLVAMGSRDAGLALGKSQSLIVERSGTQLRYSLNGNEFASFSVAADDRTPLKAASDLYNITITAAKLFYKAGEEQSDVPERHPAAVAQPRWQSAFSDSFSDADAVNRVFTGGSGKVSFYSDKRALLLDAGEGGEIYAALHKSLPGDIRVRFKALRSKASEQVSIGLVFGSTGKFGADIYFAEWARGIVQLKRQGHILKRLDVPTPNTPDRWVTLELRRLGPIVTLCMEDQELLTYTEANPLVDADHDLCAFYVWSDRTLIRDVKIDRNMNDPIKPQASDPATKANLIEGTRNPGASADF